MIPESLQEEQQSGKPATGPGKDLLYVPYKLNADLVGTNEMGESVGP